MSGPGRRSKGDVVSYGCAPWRRRKGEALFASAVAAVCAWSAVRLMGSVILAVPVVVVFFAVLSNFFLETVWSMDGEGVEVRSAAGTSRLAWSEVDRIIMRNDAVYLRRRRAGVAGPLFKGNGWVLLPLPEGTEEEIAGRLDETARVKGIEIRDERSGGKNG